MVAEYVLKDSNKPMGVSKYKLSNRISEELQDMLPSIEDIKKYSIKILHQSGAKLIIFFFARKGFHERS